jgi:hypothetical protein
LWDQNLPKKLNQMGMGAQPQAAIIQVTPLSSTRNVLGTISNEWMSLVGTALTLANSIVCLKLVPMIEAALVGLQSRLVRSYS